MAVARRHRHHLRCGLGVCDETGKARSALNLLRPRRLTEWIALALVVLLIVGAAASGVWLSRYAVIVHRLTRGIGDTVFYGADGQPWFRLDEQRHDVAQIGRASCRERVEISEVAVAWKKTKR